MIYFLSDAHLGSLAIEKGWAHQKKLIDLLEEMSKDAVSIYMLGDMFTSISSPAIMISGPSAAWRN